MGHRMDIITMNLLRDIMAKCHITNFGYSHPFEKKKEEKKNSQ